MTLKKKTVRQTRRPQFGKYFLFRFYQTYTRGSIPLFSYQRRRCGHCRHRNHHHHHLFWNIYMYFSVLYCLSMQINENYLSRKPSAKSYKISDENMLRKKTFLMYTTEIQSLTVICLLLIFVLCETVLPLKCCVFSQKKNCNYIYFTLGLFVIVLAAHNCSL